MTRSHPTPGRYHQSQGHRDVEYQRWTQRASEGGLNICGNFTLTTGTYLTVVTDRLVTFDSVVLPVPITTSAAAALTSMYVQVTTNGSFTLRHDSSTDESRIFNYVVFTGDGPGSGSGAGGGGGGFVLGGVFDTPFADDHL